MASKSKFTREQISASNPMFSRLRTIVETSFYGSNVVKVESLAEAYELAKNSPGTLVTDMPIEQPESIGLPSDAKVLLFNDGAVTGRAAAARRILGNEGVDPDKLDKKVMDAVYDLRWSKLYHAEAIVGLDEGFMVKAHLLIPEGEENILYNWMLNFQPLTDEYKERYDNSKEYDEGDIFVISDPQWSDEDHPLGLTYFDPDHSCAAFLGMRYFGEHKKGTLTLAWSIANRNCFASCHGGLKEFSKEGMDPYTLAVFGLSGSGKSTITHATHDDKYNIKILHDDAFIIHTGERYSIALEPTYFDKTQDYPAVSPDNKYLLTVQNCGATRDEDGKLIIVSEDIRNGNGRAIKSKLWSPNRVDRVDSQVNAICWIMKDPVLPPLTRIKNPTLASLMGATLSTKRTTAERLADGIDPNALVIEPYANPFRTWSLAEDFEKFRALFKDGVECYILNTGHFLDKKVDKETTLTAVENVAEGKGTWKEFPGVPGLEYMAFEGFELPEDERYLEAFMGSMKRRQGFLEELSDVNRLPEEAYASLDEWIGQIDKK